MPAFSSIALLLSLAGLSDALSESEVVATKNVEYWLSYADTKSNWTEEDRTKSLAVAQVQFILWTGCIARNRNAFLNSKEPVETVATAVISSCKIDENRSERITELAYRGLLNPAERSEQARQQIANMRAKFRESLIQFFVEKRL